ncbi:MAG: hypothetical protein QOE93_1585 [Actinomycetota bacterium]|nr:hypothetical protein [Actinomycetota bacterium]
MVPLAGLLAVCNVAVGGWIISAEQNPGSIVGGSLFILGGIALAAGLVVRPRNQRLGTALVLAGAFWGLPLFWTIIPPILALVVMAGVLAESRTGAAGSAGSVHPHR